MPRDDGFDLFDRDPYEGSRARDLEPFTGFDPGLGGSGRGTEPDPGQPSLFDNRSGAGWRDVVGAQLAPLIEERNRDVGGGGTFGAGDLDRGFREILPALAPASSAVSPAPASGLFGDLLVSDSAATVPMGRTASGAFVPAGPAEFDDPLTAPLEAFTRRRFEELQQPVQDPASRLLEELFAERITALRNPVQDAADRLMAALGTSRIQELQAEPFTEAEERARIVAAEEDLNRREQAARREAMERLMARGHAPSSGTIEAAVQDVARMFEGERGRRRNLLLMEGIGERQARRRESLTIADALRQLQERVLERGESRERERLSVAEALRSLTSGRREEEERRRREALAVGAVLPELGERRLQNALAVLAGAVPTPSSLFQQLAALAAQGQSAEAVAAQRQSGIGNLLGLLLSRGFGTQPIIPPVAPAPAGGMGGTFF